MITNFEEVETYLDARKNRKRLIKFEEDFYPEDLERLRGLALKYTFKEIEDTLIRTTDEGYCPPAIIKFCKRCGDSYRVETSKTGFIDFLRNPRDFYCSECKKLNEIESERLYALKIQESKKDCASKTSDFIENFLIPGEELNWGTHNTPSKKFNVLISMIGDCDQKAICEHIKSMKYYDFLKTQYWRVVANKKRLQNNFKCELCSSEERIAVHHKNYDNHGYEHANLKDLIALCSSCHSKFHDKVK